MNKLFVALADMAGPNGSTAELADRFDEVVVPTTRESAIEELRANGKGISAAIVGVKERVDSEVLQALPNLRVLGTVSTGTDHLDLDALDRAQVTLVAASGINGPTVAEHALSMMLSLLKHSIQSHFASLDGSDRAGLPSLSRSLRNRRVSILGAGATATWLVRLLQPFDCDVMVWTPHPEEHQELLGMGACFGEIDELFSCGEVVSLHLPLTPETRGIVNEARLRSLPQRSVLVNTARKELLDSKALQVVFADRSDLLLGIDDFALKDEVSGLDASRVLASPHVAGVTEESMSAMEHHVVTEIARIVDSFNG